mgnify:CR=1 FL=1
MVMPSRSLAALLIIALAAPAWAQVRLATEKQTFAVKIRIRDAYAGGADLQALDLAALSNRSDSASSELLDLYEQARYVQGGREPEDKPDAYVAFIRSVARRLGTRSDKAVELYGDRVRKRSSTATTQDIAIREAIATDIRQNRDIPEATRRRIARNLVNTSRTLLQDMSRSAGLTADGAPAAGRLQPGAVFADMPHGERPAVNYNELPPQVQPVPFIPRPAPSPAPATLPDTTGSALSWSALASYLDWDRGKRVAAEAFNGALNYVANMGRVCYQFVKNALRNADTNLRGLRFGAAHMFSEDVKRNPAILQRMGYRRVSLAQMGNNPSLIPDGSILAYAPGCSFADARFGHMEITLSDSTYAEMIRSRPSKRFASINPNEVPVCHFNCTKRSMPFLRTYGRDRKVGGVVEKACLHMYVPVKAA